MEKVMRNDFEKLANNAYGKVYRFAMHLVGGNRDDASDLVQDALVRACRAFSKYDCGFSFDNWLMRIVYNRFLDSKRAQRRRIAPVSYDALAETDQWSDVASPDPSPEKQMLDRFTDPQLVKAWTNLAENHRQILHMSLMEDFTYREIGQRLGIPEGTVRSRVHRAQIELRKNYQAVDRAQKLKAPSRLKFA